MTSISHYPHSLNTKYYAVLLYRNGNPISFVCRRYKCSKASLMRWNKKFDGSKILAIASYNAGPEATNRLIKDFGDPRKMAEMDDVVDWIESINYKETRNYVQRILENLVIYEQILGIE